MAGSRIKGITVEIGGNTTKLQSDLKGVNSEIKNTQSQLKDVEKLLKLDPGNTELLAQKQKLLSSAVSETKEKLAMPTHTLSPLMMELHQCSVGKAVRGEIRNVEGCARSHQCGFLGGESNYWAAKISIYHQRCRRISQVHHN